MSQPDLNDPRFEKIVRELHERAPGAPDALRERVRTTARAELAEPRRRLPAFGLRRGLALGAAGIVAVGLGAALVNGLAGPGQPQQQELGARDAGSAGGATRSRQLRAPQTGTVYEAYDRAQAQSGTFGRAFSKKASALPPAKRLQNYHASIRLRVDDADGLSAAAQRAMRDARRMGGFVASVDFATESEGGNATLVLRVPVGRIQEAVARFSELGTILAQQVSIDDLQPEADRLAATIARHGKRIAELETKLRNTGLTPAEQYQLDSARRQLRTLTQRRASIVRQATYATVAVELTTEKSDQKEEPGAFGAFWDDASKILVTELVWLLYALVVAGPFLLLALLALLAERARRRRGDDALLAHH